MAARRTSSAPLGGVPADPAVRPAGSPPSTEMGVAGDDLPDAPAGGVAGEAAADVARGATGGEVDDPVADVACDAAARLAAPPAIRTALLAWYDAHRRELPWRAPAGARPDAYVVFVSEVMLQQTRVETVLRHFGPWMARFPGWAALAAAPEQEVLAQWAGLGYYRRARNLHATARLVVADGLPRDAAGLRQLPGVGPYMAAAVASIAFGQPVAAVDGNVVRVVARLADIDGRVDRAAGRRAVEDLADTLVDPARPGDWNQALMDLGATVCTPRPRCDACPVAPHCSARAHGTQHERPVAGAKPAPRRESMHFALLQRAGRVLVVPRPDDGLLAGTWMLPGGPAEVGLLGLVRQQTGLEVVLAPEAAPARHVFTHRVWDMRVHVADVLPRHGADVIPRHGADVLPRHRVDVLHGDAAHMARDGATPDRPGRGDPGDRPAAGRWVDPDAPDVALSTCCRKAIEAAATLRAARPSPFV